MRKKDTIYQTTMKTIITTTIATTTTITTTTITTTTTMGTSIKDTFTPHGGMAAVHTFRGRALITGTGTTRYVHFNDYLSFQRFLEKTLSGYQNRLFQMHV